MPTAAQHGDFAAFYDATWGRTVACAYAITGDLDAAEDVAQEAYSRAWSRWQRLQQYDEPAAWVRQVATREAISRWRRARTAVRHLVRQREPEPHAPPGDDTLLLVRALSQLPLPQRRALVLHHLAGMPVDEVARVENARPGTVKARLSRGRAALAVLLGEEPAAPPGDGSPGTARHAETDKEARHV